jgi:hypothetical protein
MNNAELHGRDTANSDHQFVHLAHESLQTPSPDRQSVTGTTEVIEDHDNAAIPDLVYRSGRTSSLA